MKKLKKPSREQKKFLLANKMDPKEYLVERDTPESYVFYHKPTEILVTIIK